ncbi:putative phosphatase regulatory subunit-domain-containing protein [Russula compacta]|nr:putative phosphatase regulatory subunit-domain-containing protein [Russula compacta]
MAASASRHARAQSMPSTPAFGPKNVHFKEKEDGLESVRLFRRTGKPVSVSKPTSDTETETEPEPSGFPFPRVSSLTEIANCSTVPAPNPSPYANVHLESITLPPARPPILRGTVLVRNVVFEKHVGVRFTLDDWTTVSEVLAAYAGPVGQLETLAGTNQGKTVGDLIGPGAASGWDRFNFAIKLEDYEAYLWQRTLFLVIRYSAGGVGEFWDNNSGENYRVTFRPHATGPVQPQPERKRGSSVPSVAPFLLCASPVAPLASRVSTQDEPRPTFSPQSDPRPSRALHPLRFRDRVLQVFVSIFDIMRLPLLPHAIRSPSACLSYHHLQEATPDKEEVDEGFATGSEDGDVAETRSVPRPHLSLKISPPTPVTVRQVSPISPTPSPPPRQQGPFSPIREPFSPRSGGVTDDSTYAALIREWCFAQGPDAFGAGTTIGAQSPVPWVGGMS